MRRPYGVFVNGLLMNRFLTQMGAAKLQRDFEARGIRAEIKTIGDVLEAE